VDRGGEYFFKMSKYQAWLVDYVQTHADFIRPSATATRSWDFCAIRCRISRSARRAPAWSGGSRAVRTQDVTYVWFDALINYVSALGGPGDTRYETFWAARSAT